MGRLARDGVGALSTPEALDLFDTARIMINESVLVPVRLDLAVLRGRSDQGQVPSLLRESATAPVPTAAVSAPAPGPDHEQEQDRTTGFAQRLRAMPEADRRRALLDLVRTHAAVVLAESTPESIDPGQGFVDLGFDSLANLELQERLQDATGLQLPSTLVFDYPTAEVLADHLCAEFDTGETAAVGPALAELDRLEQFLTPYTDDDQARTAITHRLKDLLARWGTTAGTAPTGPTSPRPPTTNSSTYSTSCAPAEAKDQVDTRTGFRSRLKWHKKTSFASTSGGLPPSSARLAAGWPNWRRPTATRSRSSE
ncbi:phosphopantetheine-binding protein [Kitasatospora aburaviensis]